MGLYLVKTHWCKNTVYKICKKMYYYPMFKIIKFVENTLNIIV